MNPGILTSGYRSPPLPYGLLGRPTQVLMPDAYRPTHAEAADWAARVVANGGSATVTTIRALSRFCDAIDAAGLRDRFYRLNLFCGDNLASCLVPLYRNTSPSLSPLGSETDANVNFVSSDYSERVGLDANNITTKYLDTGLTIDALPTRATGHMAYFRRPTRAHPALGTNPRVMGSIGAVNNHIYGIRGERNSFAQSIDAQWGHTGTTTSTGARFTRPGLLLGSRISASNYVVYFNGSAEAGDFGAGRIPGANANTILVFNWRQADGTVAGAGWVLDISCYSVGAGMTQRQVVDYYAALVALYSSLGRAV